MRRRSASADDVLENGGGATVDDPEIDRHHRVAAAPFVDELLEHPDALGLPLGGVLPRLLVVHGRVVQLPSGDHHDLGVPILCDIERMGEELTRVGA